jgi:hypothetical protein
LGVNIFILTPIQVEIEVCGLRQQIGTLRRFGKLTELDEQSSAEMRALEALLGQLIAPIAAMNADIIQNELEGGSRNPIKAHEVIGWDEDRTHVLDLNWDFLPTIGYAVQDHDRRVLVLHEKTSGGLRPVTQNQATASGLIDSAGRLVRQGQPKILECWNVRQVMTGYADANCRLENGETHRLLTATAEGEIPPSAWFVGKRQRDVRLYAPNGDKR